MDVNRRNVLLSAPPAIVVGTGLGAVATCSPTGIQIDPNVIVAINNAVATGCNFIPAITTTIAIVNALFPAVNGATTVAQGVISQIADMLCKNVVQSGKLGGSIKAGDADIPIHGWHVVDGKLVYV